MGKPTPQATEPQDAAALTPRELAKKFIFPALFVAVLLAVASHFIGLARLGAILLAAKPWPLAGLLGFHLCSLLFHTLRIQVLFRGSVSAWDVFHANNICNMVNSILPLRAGEFAIALLLSRKVHGGGGEVLSTILVDRLLGLISILAIFLAVLPGFSPHGAAATSLAHSGIYYCLAFGGITLGIFIAVALEEWLLAVARSMLQFLPLDVESTLLRLRSCINGLRVLFHFRTSVPAFLLALFTWACVISLNYCGITAVVETTTITAAVFVSFLTIVGIMLVATPSGVGTAHGASVLALSMFGVGAEQALASAILTHGLVLMVNIGIGLVSAQKMHFRLRDVMSPRTKKAAESGELKA